MVKTVSVAELGHGGASRAIRDAQDEPVLVSKENRPAAWIVSAQDVAAVAAARGVDSDVYRDALELVALDLYRRGVLTLGQAAKMAGMHLADFIDLCGSLHVPVLWESERRLGEEVDAIEAVLAGADTPTES